MFDDIFFSFHLLDKKSLKLADILFAPYIHDTMCHYDKFSFYWSPLDQLYAIGGHWWPLVAVGAIGDPELVTLAR